MPTSGEEPCRTARRGPRRRRRPAPRRCRPRPGRCRAPGRRSRGSWREVRTTTTSSRPRAASGPALWPVLCGATRRPPSAAARTTAETSAAVAGDGHGGGPLVDGDVPRQPRGVVRRGPRAGGRGRAAQAAQAGRPGASVAVDRSVVDEVDGHGGCSLVGSVVLSVVEDDRVRGAAWDPTWESTWGAGDGRPPVPMLRVVEVGVLGPVEVGWTVARSTSARPSSARWWPRWPSPAAGRSSVDAIVDLLWGDGAAAGRDRHAAGLRLAACAGCSSPTGARRAPATVLVTVGAGLRAAGGRRTRWTPSGFERAVDAQHRRLQPLSRSARPRCRRDELDRRGGGAGRRAGALARHAVRRARGRARRPSPSGPGSRSCGWSRWRTGRSPPSRWAPRDRGRRAGGADRGAPAARAALGAAGARADPGRAAGGRARGAARRCARCSTTSSGSSPAPSCATSRRRCCGRTRAGLGGRRRQRPPVTPFGPPGRRARSRAGPRRPVGAGRPPGRWSAATPSSRRCDEALAARRGRAPRVRRAHRRARHRQVPAGRRAGGAGPTAAGTGCWSGAARRTTARRRCGRGDGARARSAAEPARRRAGPTDEGGASSAPGSGSPGRSATRPRERPRAGRARRPALGRHLARCGCCGCSPRPPTDERAAGARHLARAPRADRRAGRRRRGAGPSARRAPRAGRAARRTTSAEVFATVAHNRPSRRPGRARCAQRTDGNPFFLVEYARLAGERADLARLLAEEHPPTAVQEVLTRRLARLPERHGRRAAHGGGDRPRSSTPRRWRRSPASTRTTCSTSSSRPRPPGWCARTASTGSASPTRWSATPWRAGLSADPPGPGARPGRRRRCEAAAAGRPRRPCTGSPPGRRTPAGPGAPPSTPPRGAALLRPRAVRRPARGRRCAAMADDPTARPARPLRRADAR